MSTSEGFDDVVASAKAALDRAEAGQGSPDDASCGGPPPRQRWTLKRIVDTRAGWWLMGMLAGWLIAAVMCRWEDSYVSAEAPMEQPVVERPVMPVS